MVFATKTLIQKTEDRERRTAVIRHPSSVIRRQGFTLVEIVVAIGLMIIIALFAGSIFKTSIDSYRTAMAQAEIMQKLRVITQQLDSDFTGLQKDGYLAFYTIVVNRNEHSSDPSPRDFNTSGIYFFCTGDFQSWFNSDIKSNIARVYFGHEWWSIANPPAIPVDRWRLAHDVNLLCPELTSPPVDVNNVSYAWYKVNPYAFDAVFNSLPPDINLTYNPFTIRRLLCENAGQMVIDWTDGTTYPNGAIAWFGFVMQRSAGDPLNGIPADLRYADPVKGPFGTKPIESKTILPPIYTAYWVPTTPAELWPKALRFTFTLYDSRGVIRDGQTFTHIVYLGD